MFCSPRAVQIENQFHHTLMSPSSRSPSSFRPLGGESINHSTINRTHKSVVHRGEENYLAQSHFRVCVTLLVFLASRRQFARSQIRRILLLPSLHRRRRRFHQHHRPHQSVMCFCSTGRFYYTHTALASRARAQFDGFDSFSSSSCSSSVLITCQQTSATITWFG